MNLLRYSFGIIFIFVIVSCSIDPNQYLDPSSTDSTGKIQISSKAQPTSVPMGETLTWTVEVTAEGSADVSEPEMEFEPEGFQIISKSHSTQFQYINGNKKKSTVLTLVLLAVEPGTYSLPAFQIKDNEQIVKSESIEVNVTQSDLTDPNSSLPKFEEKPKRGLQDQKRITNETLL